MALILLAFVKIFHKPTSVVILDKSHLDIFNAESDEQSLIIYLIVVILDIFQSS